MHIRRTDKLAYEASEFDVQDYMKHVIEYFDIWELKNEQKLKKKHVFVATDEAMVIRDLVNRYPDYDFIYQYNASISARPENRNQVGLTHLIIDIFHLSQSDYLVCTFSSNVGRMAFELMHSRHVDASQRAVSIDREWVFRTLTIPVSIAIDSNSADGELVFQRGDFIKWRNWNIADKGYKEGINMRTWTVGQVPVFKTETIHSISAGFKNRDEIINMSLPISSDWIVEGERVTVQNQKLNEVYKRQLWVKAYVTKCFN